MFNQLTFGTDDVTISLNREDYEVHTGNFFGEGVVESKVIQAAVNSLPTDLKDKLERFLKNGYPLVFRKVSLFKGDVFRAIFHPLSDNTCGIVLGLDRKGRLDPESVRHELVHYDQFIRGDLAVTSQGEIIWKGEVYGKAQTNRGQGYFNTPWEQEAYQTQFEWAHETGVTRLRPDTRMKMAHVSTRWYDFMRSFTGASLLAACLIALMVVMPTSGFWWIPQILVGGFTVLQVIGVVALSPPAQKLAQMDKEVVKEKGKWVQGMAAMAFLIKPH